MFTEHYKETDKSGPDLEGERKNSVGGSGDERDSAKDSDFNLSDLVSGTV